jgi:hypothetical protein
MRKPRFGEAFRKDGCDVKITIQISITVEPPP